MREYIFRVIDRLLISPSPLLSPVFHINSRHILVPLLHSSLCSLSLPPRPDSSLSVLPSHYPTLLKVSELELPAPPSLTLPPLPAAAQFCPAAPSFPAMLAVLAQIYPTKTAWCYLMSNTKNTVVELRHIPTAPLSTPVIYFAAQ